MPYSVHPSRSLGYLLLLGVLVAPAAAHNVQTAGDVGGTLHIEPNDNPQAGKPALTWFALTRRGGQVIPLKECSCQLAVYAQPRSGNSQPVLEPTLEVVKAEQYQGIPGAAIAFPKAGAYELELRGTPKAGANFQPFELQFPVTVTGAASAASPPQSSRQATPQTPATGRALPTFIIPAVIIALGALWFFLKRSKPK